MFIRQSIIQFKFRGFTVRPDFFYGKDSISLFVSSGWTCNNNAFVYRPGSMDGKLTGSWERYDNTEASEHIVCAYNKVQEKTQEEDARIET